MYNDSLSPADIAVLSGNNGGNGNSGFGNGDWSAWIIIFLIFALGGFGRNGFGGGNYVVSDKLNGEVYVKILYDTSMDEYFWHINFVTPNGVNIASVINIHNGEVLTNNTNIF